MNTINTLLVDDSSVFLNSAANFLADFPHVRVVGRANSGFEALRLINQARPDLVLVDLAMPHMNGIQLTAKIKALPNPPKVIMLTFAAAPDYRPHALSAGADGFLGKDSVSLLLMPEIDSMFPSHSSSGGVAVA